MSTTNLWCDRLAQGSYSTRFHAWSARVDSGDALRRGIAQNGRQVTPHVAGDEGEAGGGRHALVEPRPVRTDAASKVVKDGQTVVDRQERRTVLRCGQSSRTGPIPARRLPQPRWPSARMSRYGQLTWDGERRRVPWNNEI